MAKKILSTDFKDDVLASTMSEKRRYREIQNIDGTVSFEDVTDYTQIGSTFGAGQINAMNEAANNSFDASKIIDDYDTLLANTQSGYAAGALAVKELNSNLDNSNIEYISSISANTTKNITLSSSFKFVVLGCKYNGGEYLIHVFDIANSKLAVAVHAYNGITNVGFSQNKSIAFPYKDCNFVYSISDDKCTFSIKFPYTTTNIAIIYG